MSESLQAQLDELLSSIPARWHAAYIEGFWQGYQQAGRRITCNLIRQTSFNDEMIEDLVDIDIEQVRKLRKELQR
ncbi:hypothetical protein [Halomonas caseinilytica]|uniref:hypothetical protein n=1 Tax=Halomonas caseinilytica TaxID=438744 RepID=UPI0008491D3B|nr:hypothetical protein [Halomonas caseinilytica]